MEKVRRWIPFVFWEICLSDEKCGYEVVYWESFAEIKKRQFLVSDLERKGVLSLCSMLSGIKKRHKMRRYLKGSHWIMLRLLAVLL
ncbi:hypothetical protein CGI28_13170, partial [Vibrio parahaemolyticus]|uniref:hypothetical protein n=1 Tax=Vibrio parahaemolyticus TaxID=670 RepID=UPI00116ED5F4